MDTAVTLAIASGAVVLGLGLRVAWGRVTQQRLREQFRMLCQQLGLMASFHETNGTLMPVAVGQVRGRTIRIESVLRPLNQTPRLATRISVTHGVELPERLTIRRDTVRGQRSNENPTPTGDTSFDGSWLLAGSEAARAWVDEDLRHQLVELAKDGVSDSGIEITFEQILHDQDGLVDSPVRRERLQKVVGVMLDLAEQMVAGVRT